MIGGGDWSPFRVVHDVVEAAEAGRPVALRYPRAVRPWQHVLDPLAGYLMLAQAMVTEPSTVAGGAQFRARCGLPAPGQRTGAGIPRRLAQRLCRITIECATVHEVVFFVYPCWTPKFEL